MRCSTRSSTSIEKVRTVPCSVQLSGMMLVASPASSMVTEITAASAGRVLREITVWKACTSWQATGTGSLALCGMAAWPPLPRSVMRNSLLEAITGPAEAATSPAGMPGQLCRPNTASIGKRVNRPSSIMAWAPAPPSSAGWKMK